MDAADIFHKLSAGTKFVREKSKLKNAEDVNKNQIVYKGLDTLGRIRKRKVDGEKSKLSIGDKKNTSKSAFIQLFKDVPVEEIDENRCYNTKKKKSKVVHGKGVKEKQIKKEQLAEFRNKLRISTYGKRVTHPFTIFDELIQNYGVSRIFINNLYKSGISSPTPIQMQAIPPMLQGRQVMACAPTGSGKTIAFLLPVLHHLQKPMNKGIRAVIVSPTRELARQTYRECLRISEDLLVTTPNRLVYLLNQEPPCIELKNVEWLIIDESDKLFESGLRGFRDQLAVIYNACENVNVKRAMFSATYSSVLAKWCKKNLKDLITVNVGVRNSAVSGIHQELLFVGNEQGKLLAIRDLIRKGITPPVLVFVQTKERARELFNELIYDGINVDVIHSDRTQKQRDNVIQGFREGKIWILICTELMGRGIDFKGVSLVVNYDFPPTTVSYIHRIGRTGRAGRPGRAITYFTFEDETNLRNIACILKESGCPVPEFILKLKKSNKRDLKKLASRAPRRQCITTTPIYERIYERKKKIKENKLKHCRLAEVEEMETKE